MKTIDVMIDAVTISDEQYLDYDVVLAEDVKHLITTIIKEAMPEDKSGGEYDWDHKSRGWEMCRQQLIKNLRERGIEV